MVMDEGNIAEFNVPLRLYDSDGIFKGMCNQSGITRDEIVRASRM